MPVAPTKLETEPASKAANDHPPDIAAALIPDALATLHVNPDTGLTRFEVDVSLMLPQRAVRYRFL